MPEKLLAPSCRVAIAALLHDLGKLAERAGINHAGRLDAHKTLFCRKAPPDKGGYHTHVHAAYTGLAWDELEITGHFPDLKRKASPFSNGSDDVTDSAVNAAARHHIPDSFLQWIVATADRVASGFERSEFDTKYNNAKDRDNYLRARLLTLFEQLDRPRIVEGDLLWRYPLKPLAPESIFPSDARTSTPQDDGAARLEYSALWNTLLDGLNHIPISHNNNLPLWLDHFDSLWLSITHAIPSATAFGIKPDVSLYDHCKATAALATALWRWHHDCGQESATVVRESWDERKFLLVQGDFSGIQDFIFAEGGQTQKASARLLRGRSFQVALLAELAALAVLEALQLPPTSQIVNAAGKFLVVAPNTDATQRALASVKQRLDAWFLVQTFGESSLQLACLPASCNDLTAGKFTTLVKQLFAQLERAKLARFDLAGNGPEPIRTVDFAYGACAFDGRRPAETTVDGQPASWLAADQIVIGKRLADPAYTRLLIARADADIWVSRGVEPLSLDYFGYRVAFARGEDEVGRFGELAASGDLLRCWDMSLPQDGKAPLFAGYARREINAYIPIDGNNEPITLDVLARLDEGIEALAVLKGDVDHLGAIFQEGIQPHTFARMAGLSRQLNAFFALYLPWLCRSEYPHTYTVFAGGDDFFLIGPWHTTQALARRMRDEFARFVAGNSRVSFSAGLVLAKPGFPIRQLAREAEARIEAAKDAGRNRLTSHGTPVLWSQVARMGEFETWLTERAQLDGFSTGFVYRLLTLADMAASDKPEDAIWQAWLAYRVKRFVVDKLPKEHRAAAQTEIAGALRQHLATGKLAARIALENHLYRHRERKAR